jgi:hypothetical protein
MKLTSITEMAHRRIDPMLLDIEDWDKEPDFRATILLFNKHGFATTSSCAGHAPGTQYAHVQEWMEPYITFAGDNAKQALRILDDGGFVDEFNDTGDHVAVSLYNDVDWAKVLRHVINILR